ncbi:MAG TPA: peptidoglycan DD-metalloendopeptidase family protein [Candidatus Paceibacterota bacterium]|nr:peptidoglycan DD-metalloendopeptidase family protein [Candidatus Paceibacterota bacterium]
MALLETKASSAGVLIEKKEKKENGQNTEDTELVVDQNALVPTVNAMGGPENTDREDFSWGITVYVVRAGDTLSQLAEMFEVSQNTILWANNMKKSDKIKEGDVLLILPVSGIEHTVKKGETLKSIASKYKIEVNDIIWHNNLEDDASLSVGDKLIIPGAEIEEPKVVIKAPAGSKASGSNLKAVNGYFINPVPGARRTRGPTSTHHGVDLAAPTGTPIYAAASGRVSLARLGYNGGFGNMVIIKHPNGTETLYAHMSRLGTSTGAQVKQGQVIGYIGNTGRSTGPHLHIEVKGARNPF